VQHERVIAHAGIHERLLDELEAFEIEVLFAFEFVSAVAVADGDSERIAAGFLDEFNGLVRFGVMAAGGVGTTFFAFVKLCADEVAEFGFNHGIVLVRVFDD
jgi:hypothetical protein